MCGEMEMGQCSGLGGVFRARPPCMASVPPKAQPQIGSGRRSGACGMPCVKIRPKHMCLKFVHTTMLHTAPYTLLHSTTYVLYIICLCLSLSLSTIDSDTIAKKNLEGVR